LRESDDLKRQIQIADRKLAELKIPYQNAQSKLTELTASNLVLNDTLQASITNLHEAETDAETKTSRIKNLSESLGSVNGQPANLQAKLQECETEISRLKLIER